MKANCSTVGHVLTTPATILRTSVVAVMLPSGLRLVPATLAHLTGRHSFFHLHLNLIDSLIEKTSESPLINFNRTDLNISAETSFAESLVRHPKTHPNSPFETLSGYCCRKTRQFYLLLSIWWAESESSESETSLFHPFISVFNTLLETKGERWKMAVYLRPVQEEVGQ